jgi:hypothetical protein
MPKWIVSLFLLSSVGGAQEPSAESFEKRMHNIYRQSYSEEISDERWVGYLSGVSNRTYTVRPGDTLWDLSVVFFGDGLFWSKIWSYNERLTNPHLLAVGQTLRFFTGSVEEAPQVTVGDTGTEEVPEQTSSDVVEGAESVPPSGLPAGFKEVKTEVTSKSSSATIPVTEIDSASPADGPTGPTVGVPRVSRPQLYPGAPAIPPPSRLVRPVLKNLPNTFADADNYDASQYDEKGISMDVRPPVRVNPLFVAHSFLYGRNAKNYPNIGRIVESENKTKLVGLNQMLYVRSSEDLQVGERFTVMGRDYPFDRNGFIGDVIEYQGAIEITERLQDGLYRGVIIKSLSGIKGLPWISREPIPTFKDDYQGRPSSTKLRVIGGGKDNVTRFYGQSDVVFLRGGTNRGVRVGDIMGVYKRRDIRFSDTEITVSPVPIGHLKVFRVEPEVTSAFVISSDDVIIPGDQTGPPTLVEAIAVQSEKDDLDSIETGLDFQTDPEVSDEDRLEEELEIEYE